MALRGGPDRGGSAQRAADFLRIVGGWHTLAGTEACGLHQDFFLLRLIGSGHAVGISEQWEIATPRVLVLVVFIAGNCAIFDTAPAATVDHHRCPVVAGRALLSWEWLGGHRARDPLCRDWNRFGR